MKKMYVKELVVSFYGNYFIYKVKTVLIALKGDSVKIYFTTAMPAKD